MKKVIWIIDGESEWLKLKVIDVKFYEHFKNKLNKNGCELFAVIVPQLHKGIFENVGCKVIVLENDKNASIIEAVADLPAQERVLVVGGNFISLPFEEIEKGFEMKTDAVVFSGDAPNNYLLVLSKLGTVVRVVPASAATILEKQKETFMFSFLLLSTGTIKKFLPYAKHGAPLFMITELLVNNKIAVGFQNIKWREDICKITTAQEFSSAVAMENKNNIIKLQSGGVIFENPYSCIVGMDVVVKGGSYIGSNCLLFGKTEIGNGCEVLAGSQLEGAKLGTNVIVNASVVCNSSVGDFCTVGPYAHILKESVILDSCRIGTFVQIKNSKLGRRVKAAHHAYLGDSVIGNNVNIGCGVVTVNYDGVNKHTTTIEDDVFVGSNVNLVAPIKIGAGAIIAAGSTIVSDVLPDDLAIARSFQINKPNYANEYFKSKRQKN